MRIFYLTTSSSFVPSLPSSTRKRRIGCSDSVRSTGSFEKDHEWNVRWLREARRVLKLDGTLWVSGTHHIIFSLGFALQSLSFRVINDLIWVKPDPPPNALHTAFTHWKAVATSDRWLGWVILVRPEMSFHGRHHR